MAELNYNGLRPVSRQAAVMQELARERASVPFATVHQSMRSRALSSAFGNMLNIVGGVVGWAAKVREAQRKVYEQQMAKLQEVKPLELKAVGESEAV